MKATEAKLLDFLKKSPQFIIPIYQRTYSWNEPQCQQLWDDILRAGSDDNIGGHFIGSVVYIEQGLYQVSSQSPLLVIDGQQRLTTAMLIIEALCRRLGDDEPIDGFSARKLRSYWLRRLENHGRKERVPVDEYTIEHILPQNENLSAKWREALGSDWQRVQESWLHTLGNLTLTGYNTEYSDRPFSEKRDMQGGFKQSPLRLNEGLGALDTWNEEAIQTRAQRLAAQAVTVWQAPALSAETLATYRQASPANVSYDLSDHPQLATGSPMRALFDALRKEVMALDPGVTEEVLKRYVAFKAETNFVDVVPQKSRLRLSLNMAFHELHDPKGEAKDVTNLGRWGNGDVEVGLTSLDELPYVMGLVRQAFEKQMGNGGGNT